MMEMTSSPASPISRPNSRSNAFCTAGATGAATTSAASVSLTTSVRPPPSSLARSCANASSTCDTDASSSCANFFFGSEPPSLKSSASIFVERSSIRFLCAVFWRGKRIVFDGDIFKQPLLRHARGTCSHQLQHGEKIHDDLVTVFALGQPAEACLESIGKPFFKTHSDVLERQHRRCGRLHHCFRLGQNVHQAYRRLCNSLNRRFGGRKNSRTRGSAVREQKRRSPPLFAQESRCLADDMQAR